MRDRSTFNRRTLLAGAAGIAAAVSIDSLIASPAAAAPASQVQVFRSQTNGSLVHLAAPGTTLTHAAPGLAIRPQGDIYITDRAAFLAALPYRLRTSAGNFALVLSDADYYDQEQHRRNAVTWFDAADQRTILMADGAVVEEWACRVDPNRRARNDQYPTGRPTRATTSQAGADRPALRFAPPGASLVYGLFFAHSPLFYGLQRIAFTNASTLQVRMDNIYSANVAWEPQTPFPSVSVSPAPTGQLNVFTAYWNKAGDVVYRLNGTQVGAQAAFPGGFDYDGFAAAVFYATNAGYGNASQLICATGIGNAYIWKTAGFVGDLFEVWSMVEVGV